MKTYITYKICNIDEDHLKEYEHHSRGKESRVCFIERRLEGWQSNSFESFEAAVKYLEENDLTYTDFTILPIIRLIPE